MTANADGSCKTVARQFSRLCKQRLDFWTALAFQFDRFRPEEKQVFDTWLDVLLSPPRQSNEQLNRRLKAISLGTLADVPQEVGEAEVEIAGARKTPPGLVPGESGASPADRARRRPHAAIVARSGC